MYRPTFYFYYTTTFIFCINVLYFFKLENQFHGQKWKTLKVQENTFFRRGKTNNNLATKPTGSSPLDTLSLFHFSYLQRWNTNPGTNSLLNMLLVSAEILHPTKHTDIILNHLQSDWSFQLQHISRLFSSSSTTFLHTKKVLDFCRHVKPIQFLSLELNIMILYFI